MDFMEQILEEVESLAIANAEKGVGASTADVALGTFFDGAEDLNTPENRGEGEHAIQRHLPATRGSARTVTKEAGTTVPAFLVRSVRLVFHVPTW